MRPQKTFVCPWDRNITSENDAELPTQSNSITNAQQLEIVGAI